MISIITPTLNAEEYLEECISSVYSQEVPVQHFIVDGGSTDKTKEIAFRFPSFFIKKQGCTQSEAINIGLKLASGRIIGWLNADDKLEPDALKNITEFFSKNPDADLVYSDCIFINEQGKKIGKWATSIFSPERNLNYFQMIPQPTAFFRTSLLEQVGYLDERYNYAFDYDFYIRVGKNFAIRRYTENPFASFRLHPKSKTKSEGSKFEPEVRAIKKEHGAIVPFNVASGVSKAVGLFKRRL